MSQPHANGAAPPPPPLRVLVIEDNASDAAAIGTALQQADARTRIYESSTFLSGLDRLAEGDIDLVLLDLAVRDNEGLDGLRAIRTYCPAVHVVALVMSDHDSTSLRAMQLGADECLVKSKIDSERLGRFLHRLASLPRASEQKNAGGTPKRASVIGILGSKGGVGTTTVACHLSMELQRQIAGHVLLVDLDMTANSIAFLMKTQSKHTIVDAANAIIHLDEARWKDFIARDQTDLDILPSGGPYYRDDQLPGIERTRCLLRFIRSLYDWIVIDFGRLTPFAVRLCSELTQVMVISSLDPGALNGTTLVAQKLQQAGMPNVRLIINRAPKAPELTQAEIQQLMNVPIETMLPECDQQFKAGMSANHLLGQSRHFSAQIGPVARKLAGAAEEITSKKLFGLFRVRA